MEEHSGLITAVVLAGGKNTRFGGEDKAFALVGKVPMIELVIGRLRKIFTSVLVVTNSPGKYNVYTGISVAADLFKDAGPLGGIHVAMKESKTPYIFVVSCDMPYLDTAIIKEQVDYFMKHQKADALIPRMNSKIEPLHAIYRTGLARNLADYLNSATDYSIRAFLDKKDVVYFDLPSGPREKKAFININRPTDIH